MYKLGIIVVSYNYLEFFVQNHRKVTNSEVVCVYVDDQSDWSFGAEARVQNMNYKYVATYGPKHIDNSINQINAISIGFASIPSCDYYWVIDGDDYYTFDLSNILEKIYASRKNGYILSSIERSYKSENGIELKSVPIFGRFWIRRATTSQFIVSSKVLKSIVRSFDSYISDFWYDARICMKYNNELEIVEQFSIIKISHGSNDSLRYTHGYFTKILRYCRSLIIRAKHFKF